MAATDDADVSVEGVTVISAIDPSATTLGLTSTLNSAVVPSVPP